jgi:BirA family biotin operon repressor/biotin-[acetyl-CoA-carboxylase] ligase
MDLDADRIARELSRRGVPLGRPLTLATVTESTNDDAKRAAQAGAPSGAAFVADAQTRGRGRLGRSWHSPPSENLYASFLLRPALDPKVVPLVTLATGLAVADAVAPLAARATVALKWPNDVLLDGRKVAGILSEAHLGSAGSDWIVIGIGVNVHARSFPDEIAALATSLAIAGAEPLDRSALFVEIASALFARLESLRTEGAASLVAAFSERDALAGRAITVDGAAATALGITHDGRLRIRRADGTEATCVAGEVRPA